MSQLTPEESADERQWQLRPDEVAASNLDSLLASLVVLTRHFDRPMSADALISGLPLVDNRLTPALFVRAAARAGLSARLVKRPLAKLSKMVLPTVLLLHGERACMVTDLHGDEASVVVPETGGGVRRLPMDDLAGEYSGFALFVRPEYEFDGRSSHDRDEPRHPKSWFWGTIVQFWPSYAEVVLTAGIINMLALASPLFIMNVYDRVLPNQAISTLWVLVAGMALALLFDFLLRNLRGVLIDTVGRRADVLLAARIFEQVLNLQMKVRPSSTGAFTNHLREFETVRDFFTSATLASLTDLLFVGLFITIIFLIAGPLAWVPVVAVVIAVTAGLLVQWPLSQAVKQTQRESAQKHAILVETVSSLDTIKSLGAEGRMQRAWERFVGMTSRTSQKSRFYSALGVNLTTMTTQAVSICTVIGGVYLVSAGRMTMGAIIAAVILGGRAVGPLGGLANTLSRFHQSRTALTTLNRLMLLPVERPAEKRFLSRPIQHGRIEFRGVSFRYPGSDIPALADASFRIDPGERVGIIGRIGSGKTTIGRLLINLYEPDEGAALVDNVDLRQYHPSDIRRGIGFVMQDVVLFHGTVRDNIALGHPKADDALILRAAQLAGVDDFVGSHPQGYNMEVAERGQNLSGGQRQSIALARALLMDPHILMLDEPTSAMDNTSEQVFMRRLASVLKTGRTLLLTTHRMSLLRLVDRLIILDKGIIIADGPRDEVLRQLKEGTLRAADGNQRIAQSAPREAAIAGQATALPGQQPTAPAGPGGQATPPPDGDTHGQARPDP
ncbi:MAG: type I secretion system permease/ATPase, partial [Inquilinus sp.]|nr:type I secretion system permease/ATPase [Inquilinus sp.]